MTDVRQSLDKLLTEQLVQLLPARSVVEQAPLPPRQRVLHGSLREVEPDKLSQPCRDAVGLQVGRAQQGDELQQTRHGAARFIACGHLATAIEVGHPSGNEHAAIGCLKFELQDVSGSKSPGDRQILSAERVKRVVNGSTARITGIIVG